MTERTIECDACGKEINNPRHRNGHPLCVGCSNLYRDYEDHGFELFYRRLSEKIRQFEKGGLTEERLAKEKNRLLVLTDEVAE